MELHWDSIIIFLSMEGKNASQIYIEMLYTCPAYCPSYSTVTRKLREFRVFREVQNDFVSEKSDEMDENLTLIKDPLEEHPYASVRQIARLNGVPKSTVYDVLTKKLD